MAALRAKGRLNLELRVRLSRRRKKGIFRRRPIPTVSNGRPLHRSIWCLATTQPFSRNGRERSKSTVFKKNLEWSFSGPVLHKPHPQQPPQQSQPPQPPQPPHPPHLFTILATALQRHRKIRHLHPIAPHYPPHVYSRFWRPLRI